MKRSVWSQILLTTAVLLGHNAGSIAQALQLHR
jgi:hypothetical protein